MLATILEWAQDRWIDWFDEPPQSLTASLLAGGPAHRDRVAVFVSTQGEPSPRVFLKVGRGRLEPGRVEREAMAVAKLTEARLPAGRPPPVLGVLELPEAVAAAYGVVKGRRLLVPQLLGRKTTLGCRSMRSFWRQTGDFGLALAVASAAGDEGDERMLGERIGRFLQTFDFPSGDRATLESFRLDIERETIRWRKCWQHGDVAVGNVLVDRGVVRLLDWEAASDEYEPWFDLATGPIAAVVLAHRQSGVGVAEAAQRVLDQEWWTGRELSSSLNESWEFSIPVGWAITLSAMHMALRRANEFRSMHSEYVELVRLATAPTTVGRLVESMGSTR